MKRKIIGILITLLVMMTLGCVDTDRTSDVEADHTPDIEIEQKQTNDEIIVTLIAMENHDNLKLEVNSEKLTIVPFESEILSPIDINTGEELKYHFNITNSGYYESGEKINFNISIEDQNYKSRNTKSITIPYSPEKTPGFGVLTSLILFISLAQLIKRKEVAP